MVAATYGSMTLCKNCGTGLMGTEQVPWDPARIQDLSGNPPVLFPTAISGSMVDGGRKTVCAAMSV